MGDLKPIGSEKLTGQDKIKRILEIAKYNETIPSSVNENAKSVYSINLADGNDYQIVKEKQGYIIKKVVSESQLDYIEPMKNRKYFSSYSQAFKRLNLLAGELNRLNENENGVELYGEQKKFVLKTPKPEPEAVEPPAPPAEPPAVPQPELPDSPVGGEEEVDMSAEEMPDGEIDLGASMDDLELDGGESAPEGEPEMDDAMGDESAASEEMVTFKTIQKLTGKLTQKIREFDAQDGMTSEDIKYVINMVLSALDLKNLSEEDKEDIMSKFEEAEERPEGDMDMSDNELSMDDEDISSDSEVEDIQADMDEPKSEMGEMNVGNGSILDSIFKESKVDKVLSKYFEITKKEILESREKKERKSKIQEVTLRKKMTEVVKLSESVEQELVSERFLRANPSFNVVGKTNKKNIVFENNQKQIKISPEGEIL
jgi:hypothetical protein